VHFANTSCAKEGTAANGTKTKTFSADVLYPKVANCCCEGAWGRTGFPGSPCDWRQGDMSCRRPYPGRNKVEFKRQSGTADPTPAELTCGTYGSRL